VAEGFAKHFQSVHNTFTPVGYYSVLLSNDFFQLPPIPDLHILQAIKGLGDFQSVALYVYLVSLLRFAPQYSHRCLNILSTLASQRNTSQLSGKNRLLCLFRKKTTVLPLVITDTFIFSITVPKFLVFFIHEHVSNYFKHKLNSSQHDFSKANLQQQIW
jgi:hypothetical protein